MFDAVRYEKVPSDIIEETERDEQCDDENEEEEEGGEAVYLHP